MPLSRPRIHASPSVPPAPRTRVSGSSITLSMMPAAVVPANVNCGWVGQRGADRAAGSGG